MLKISTRFSANHLGSKSPHPTPLPQVGEGSSACAQRVRGAFFTLSVAAVLLSACSGSDVQDTLGMQREAPDEFVVVARPALSIPPDFHLLPPSEGEESVHLGDATDAQARALLLGTQMKPSSLDALRMPLADTAVAPVLVNEAPSGPAGQFLAKLGVDEAAPDIRQQLIQERIAPETVKKPEKETSLYEDWLGLGEEEPQLDPAKESERLRRNKDAGKPVTEGDTPMLDTHPKSTLDAIF